MKLALLVPLVLLAACKANPDDYPPGGGPGGSGSNGVIDAAVDADGDAGVVVHGRVCVLTDLRRVGDVKACAPTGVTALKLAVTLGSRTATTDTATDNGAFTITAPLGANLTWHVSGANYTTSAMQFGPDNTIPVISDLAYTELLNTNSVAMMEGQGAIVIRLVKAGKPATQITATSNPAGNRLALYDDKDSATDWNENLVGTGPFGVVWFPDIPTALTPPSTAMISLTPPVGNGSVVKTSSAYEDAVITFLTVEIP